MRLGSETEIAGLYTECEPGAMPPFGPMHGQRVFVDMSLIGDPEMTFNAGTHTDAICVHYNDLSEITRPIVGTFAKPSKHVAAV